MTFAAPMSARSAGSSGGLLIAGVVLAALAEAIAGTALSLGRADIIGDIHATPDEFAWIDIAYIAMKLTGFVLAPWLFGRLGLRGAMLGATLVIGAACVAAAMTASLDLLVALRGRGRLRRLHPCVAPASLASLGGAVRPAWASIAPRKLRAIDASLVRGRLAALR